MKLKNVGIIGLGTYVPENVMTNFDFEKIIDTSDEWIRTRTGIEERRFASADQATSDLGAEASKKALEKAGLSAEDIDMIILATTTPDYPIQSTACVVQELIGAINAAAVDINAACSGFVYALTMAKGLIASGMNKRILVIGAEVLSKCVDMQDRNTCVLFGDGAAAAVVAEVEEGYGMLSQFLGAEADVKGALRTPAGGTRKPLSQEVLDERSNFLQMKGQDVFKFAVKALPKATLEALEGANLKAENIDMVFPHQANVRIIEAASKRLEIPMDKFYLNLNKLGNTSSASIGLALGEALDKGLVKKGDTIALTGFGAGLTYASMIIKWSY
ncbi:MAG: beta-ketoacyl-ACP synthase III [Cetobacterium somerae]|jgi:3-oxoacyl-[acyl-carrier-protein] synthase-3|uniref:Beta-ketoacyl-[acyl-carrier-protein] synthase III n=4 Tax=Cetobacterium TaxID=180162 RepID=U7VAV3_9FUSO|nr:MULTISPECIES: beta-ketoacyl-ACP synthase III [Cetobacterium]ERT67938.1 beta-ketoacyl-acyl-carrier-protein synthase III [Cetobacterium somerae ATCC BAA-474]MBC2854068.1 ketoacyl-ACP synthase III [Cetobacterium sp. 2G large]MCQ9627703.1 ketoacyl-ACP synthase III [Cetobacterium somerae]WVJ00518.1 beta-ketoacyl-ACP synthase III [Cetobacterium somerae]